MDKTCSIVQDLSLIHISFNGRTYSVTDGAVNISLLEGEDIKGDNKWSAAATGYVIDNTTNKPTYSDSTHKLTVKTTAATPLSTEITVTTTEAAVTAKASLTEVISGGKTTLTASSTGLSNAATYAWFYKIGDSKEFPIGTGKSLVWTVPANVTTATDYSVCCKASEGDKLAKTSGHITVKSLPDTYTFTVVPASVTLTQIGQTATLAASFVDTSSSASLVVPTYSFVSANLNIATVTNQTTAAPTVTLRASGSTTVTAKATYKGKDYVQNLSLIHISLAIDEVGVGQGIEIGGGSGGIVFLGAAVVPVDRLGVHTGNIVIPCAGGNLNVIAIGVAVSRDRLGILVGIGGRAGRYGNIKRNAVRCV